MKRCRICWASAPVALAAVLLVETLGMGAEGKVTRYVRFQTKDETTAYGIVEGDKVRQLDGDLFRSPKPTDKTFPLAEVKLLVPSQPSKILALAGNYKSHLGTETTPKNPEVFVKVPSCLIPHEAKIVIPKGTSQVDHEGELVIVIGKRAKAVSPEKALEHVLGITCGNDVSARDWQKNDRQWWRAKGSDTFGPCGPYLVSGINYDDLQLTCRVNGEVRQQQRTKDLVFGVGPIVSFISQYVTLEPGDLIYTGTPGKTTPLKPGDVVEVDLEGVGLLRNPVTAEQ